jgi:hypothetical protein
MRQQSDAELLVPEDFNSDEWRALIAETQYWRLSLLESRFRQAANEITNTITIA